MSVSFTFLFTNAQLREIDFLRGPVVLVEAENAEELMGLVNKNEEAKVTIELLVELPSWVSPETMTHIVLTCLSLTRGGGRGSLYAFSQNNFLRAPLE